MRKNRAVSLFAAILLALLLVACDAYTETGAKTRSQQDTNGGLISASARKANGTSTKDIEVNVGGVSSLDAYVTLTVGAGEYRIELIGDDDEVTLALTARSGETVSGQGLMAVVFDQAGYRVTAVEAENVEYTIEYAFR